MFNLTPGLATQFVYNSFSQTLYAHSLLVSWEIIHSHRRSVLVDENTTEERKIRHLKTFYQLISRLPPKQNMMRQRLKLGG